MGPIKLPGRREQPTEVKPQPLSRLEERREELREKFAGLQWDLGGAAYEMAARDHFRIDVLASLASRLQLVDAELAEIERMARLERAGAAGSCSGCGSLHARGAVFCWRCGRNLSERAGTVVGPRRVDPEPGAPTNTNGSQEPPWRRNP